MVIKEEYTMAYTFKHLNLPVSQVQAAGYAYQINYLAYLIDQLQSNVENLDPESQGEAITTLQNNVSALQEAVETLQTTVAGKSEVEANPTVTGSTTALKSIELDGTAYELAAGTVLSEGYVQAVADNTLTLDDAIENYEYIEVYAGFTSGSYFATIASKTFTDVPSGTPTCTLLAGDILVSLSGTTLTVVASSNTSYFIYRVVGYK